MTAESETLTPRRVRRHEINEPSHRAAKEGPDVDTRSASGIGGNLLAGIFIFAFAIRFFEIKRSYNLFVDEVTYVRISRNLAVGKGLVLYGKPFDLHPPATFAVLAAVIRLFRLTALPVDQIVYDLRPVMALFGAGAVVLTIATMRRAGTGLAWCFLAGALIALDPFEIYYDCEVMLEAMAQFFVIATVVALLVALRRSSTSSRNRLVLALAGLSAGMAFCTKETFALVLVATLVLIVLCRGLRARRSALYVLMIGAAFYVTAISTVWFTSGFGPWWRAQTSGFTRLVGTNQTTGFNASSTHVTLLSRLAADLGQYSGTYLLLAAGAIAAVYQILAARLWQKSERGTNEQCRLIVALWAFAACGYLGYATVIGSLEEQMYYITFVPCVLTIMLGISSAWDRLPRLALRRPVVMICIALIVFDGYTWFQQHTENNNSYAQFFAWERANVAPGSRIGVAEDVAQFILKGATIGQWDTISSLRQHQADYVVVETNLVQQGYSKMSVQTLRTLEQGAVIAFKAHSSQDGELLFFDVRALLNGPTS